MISTRTTEFTKYLDMMDEMKSINQDISTQLNLDEEKIEVIGEDTETALENMTDANDELKKNRDKQFKSIKKNMWWLLCLTIVLIVLLVVTFGGGGSETPAVAAEPEKKAGDPVESKDLPAKVVDKGPALTFLNF